MAEQKCTPYLNPLTVEAQMFLQSLETFGKPLNQIDKNLSNTLEKVMIAIEEFVKQNPTQILQTETTKLIAVEELANIQRIFVCKECHQDVGRSPEKVAAHLALMHCGEKNGVLTVKETRKQARKAVREKRLLTVEQKIPKKALKLCNGATDLNAFYTERIKVAEKLKAIPDYDIIEDQLKEILTVVFPGVPIKFYKFGSRICGIATPHSDLDIFVEIGNSFNTFENGPSQQTLQNMYRVRDALSKQPKMWKRLTTIDHARVPILKVFNASTLIDCDLGFSNSLGFCNTVLLSYFIEMQPIARRMLIFIKQWLERCILGDHMSTYSFALMVVCFLQVHKHLPSVQQLQQDLKTRLDIGPWLGNFVQNRLCDFNMQHLKATVPMCAQLLRQFFEYYANLKYADIAVCPYLGQVIEIKKIEDKMPSSYATFVRSSCDVGLQLKKPMVVQDPMQLNHNVTKNVTPRLLKMMTDYFRQTAAALAEKQ